MKVCHWATITKGTMSGLVRRVMEMHKAELAVGFESGIVSPLKKDEDGYIIEGEPSLDIEGWEWAEDADVNVIDSSVPDKILSMKNRVFMAHGGPMYCAQTELAGKRHSLTTAIRMLQICDLTITQNEGHLKFWNEFVGADVRWVQGGIDLDKWGTEGRKSRFVSHPSIIYMEIWRGIKLPFTLMRSIKRVVKEIPTARLQLFNMPKGRGAWWMRFMCKLGMDHLVENCGEGVIAQPSMVYRAADMIVNPCAGGTISGVGVEALACGCPVIIYEGRKKKYASAKCKEDDPDDMAKAIVKLWKRIEADRDKVRLEARKIAEKHYDVKRMVTDMAEIYRDKFNLKETAA